MLKLWQWDFDPLPLHIFFNGASLRATFNGTVNNPTDIKIAQYWNNLFRWFVRPKKANDGIRLRFGILLLLRNRLNGIEPIPLSGDNYTLMFEKWLKCRLQFNCRTLYIVHPSCCSRRFGHFKNMSLHPKHVLNTHGHSYIY